MLDIGCGKGIFIRDFLSSLNADWGMVPTAAAGIDIVRSHDDVFKSVTPPLDFTQQDLDGDPLPYSDNEFDVISCNHVLEHIFETEILVREAHRVLKKDGLAIISVPNIATWINRLVLIFGGQPLGTEVGTESITYGFWPARAQKALAGFTPSGHIRDFTPRGLMGLTNACGFDTLGWWKQEPKRWLRLTKWSGRGMGIILGKKNGPLVSA